MRCAYLEIKDGPFQEAAFLYQTVVKSSLDDPLEFDRDRIHRNLGNQGKNLDHCLKR